MRSFIGFMLVGWMILAGLISSCNPFDNQTAPLDCPPCPNNTRCLEGDCGCTTDQHDMGSWCMDKHDQLFVAASLDCPCLSVLGLYLRIIVPEMGDGFLPQSLYSILQRGDQYNSSGMAGQFSYYEKPNGDSIVLYNIPGPGQVGFYTCSMNDSLYCEIDLFGKFHGPDTIETEVLYRRCRNEDGLGNNYKETHHLTFIRKR